MPYWCVVPTCPSNTWKTKETRSKFKVPSDPELRNKWLSLIPGIKSLKLNQRICDRHFSDDMIIKERIVYGLHGEVMASAILKAPRLRAGAVPTVFDNNIIPSKRRNKRSFDGRNKNGIDSNDIDEHFYNNTSKSNLSDSAEIGNNTSELKCSNNSKQNFKTLNVNFKVGNLVENEISNYASNEAIDSDVYSETSSSESISMKIEEYDNFTSSTYEEGKVSEVIVENHKSINSSLISLNTDALMKNPKNPLKTSIKIKKVINPSETSNKTKKSENYSVSSLKIENVKNPLQTTNNAENANNYSETSLEIENLKNPLQAANEAEKTNNHSETSLEIKKLIIQSNIETENTVFRNGDANNETDSDTEWFFSVRFDSAEFKFLKMDDENIDNAIRLQLPKPWNVCINRSGNEQILLFTYAICVNENNSKRHIFEKTVIVSMSRKIDYEIHSMPVNLTNSQLPSFLEDVTSIPNILKKFKDYKICKGFTLEQSTFLKSKNLSTQVIINAYRHVNCFLLSLKSERCKNCQKLNKKLQDLARKSKQSDYSDTNNYE